MEVPEGTITEVLGWVGDDTDRALAAIAVEQEGKQRSSLLEKLFEIGQVENQEEVADDEGDEHVASEPSSNGRIRRVLQGTPYVEIV